MEGSIKLKIYKERPREQFLEGAASLRSSQRRAKHSGHGASDVLHF